MCSQERGGAGIGQEAWLYTTNENRELCMTGQHVYVAVTGKRLGCMGAKKVPRLGKVQGGW